MLQLQLIIPVHNNADVIQVILDRSWNLYF